MIFEGGEDIIQGISIEQSSMVNLRGTGWSIERFGGISCAGFDGLVV